MEKILIIVPSFNEEKNISAVIDDIRNQNIELDILVVNDASKDDTLAIAKSKKVITLNLYCNLGIGGCVQAGYIYAYRNNYDIAIQFDGDGQHDAKYIPDLVKTLKESNAQMVIGSRFIENIGFRSSFMRRIGIFYLSKLIGYITKQKITDPTSGFRAADRKLIKLFVEYYPDDYPEPEVLVYFHKKAASVKEIPVRMKAREHGTSSIRFLRTAYYILKVTLAILVNLIRF